jgi:predicted metal-dependent peptidase
MAKSRQQLAKEFTEVIRFLDDNYAYFLTNVLRIGSPKWTNAIPTACVTLTGKPIKMQAQEEENENFEFWFNPEFWDSPGVGDNVEQRAFIVAHETMHIVLNHLKLVNSYINRKRYKELVEKMRTEGNLTERQDIIDSIKLQQIQQKLNIAMDCVINDYLVHSGFTPWSNCCRGEKYIGEDAAFLTVRDVYERLPEIPWDESNAIQIGKSDGRGGNVMDSHDWLFDPNMAEKIADAIEKMNKEAAKGGLPQDLKDKKEEEAGNETEEQKKLRESMQAGSEAGNIQSFKAINGLEMAWVKLLKQLDPNIFKEAAIGPPPKAVWHKRPRKLGARAFQEVNLPAFDGKDPKREKHVKEKPAIVMALDYSGSIGAGDADRFATLCCSIPRDRIKLFCCTFTTQYTVFDPENPHGGGIGGTDFDAITAFIEDKVRPELNGAYPKSVVVITDGQAPMRDVPTDQEGAAWLWLLSPDRSHGYPASHDIGTRDMLEEYIK